MPTTTTPLPYNISDLRTHWYAAEPADTAVATIRDAQTTIWATVVEAQTELDRLVEAERDAVAALIDAALAGDDIAQTASDLGRRSPVPSLRHHLDLLTQASSTVGYRLSTAQQTDETYLAWQAECREVEDEWQTAMNSEDRTAALIAFVELHRPS